MKTVWILTATNAINENPLDGRVVGVFESFESAEKYQDECHPQLVGVNISDWRVEGQSLKGAGE